MAGQGYGSQPTGEKRPRIAAAKGDRTAQAPERCQLCSVLKRAGLANHPHAPFGTTRGLRVALVDNDEETGPAAQDLLQALRDGWTLEVYHPPCLVREPSGGKGSPRPNALERDQGPRSPPDIVVIGLSGREDTRLACVRRIKALAPDLPVLIISGDSDEAVIIESCAAGADGCLTKPFTLEEFARAVVCLAEGRSALCPKAQAAILNALHRAATTTTAWVPGLSGREQQVAGCLLAAWSEKEIADHLGMEYGTLHVHLVRIYKKLGIHSRNQAVAKLLGVWHAGGGATNPF